MWHSLMENNAPATLGFVHGVLDRVAQLRGDEAAIAAFLAREDARFVAFCGENAVLRRVGEALVAFHPRAELPDAAHHREVLFLGLEDGAPRFAVIIDPVAEAELIGQDPAGSDFILTGIRAMAMERPVSAAELGAIAEGKALAFWHARHRFCANCGAKTAPAQAGWKRECAACGAEHFPRTDPVVIMLTIDGDRCLLGRQKRFVPNVYSTLAGFVEPGETIEAAVRRETFEEAGIRAGRVTIIANQPWPFPESLMIGAFAEALSTEITRDEEELEDCRWFTRDEVIAMIEKRHPQGLLIPPRMAIANHLIRLFAGMKD